MSLDLIFRKIEFGSKNYQDSLRLREQILRVPLGLRLTPNELERDQFDIHLGGFRGDELVACLILSRVGENRMKMRQVAVRENLQNQGIGKGLVQFSEKIALENQVQELELSARQTAVQFYLQLGYLADGLPYTEKTIPHLKMTKTLKLNDEQ